MDHNFLIHSSTDGHLGCFQHLAIANSTALCPSAFICLLTEAFNPFAFKVIVDRYVVIAILLFIFLLFFLLLKEDTLTFLIILFWCVGELLYLLLSEKLYICLLIEMMAVLGNIGLRSLLFITLIFLVNPFWLAKFLLRKLLTVFYELPFR